MNRPILPVLLLAFAACQPSGGAPPPTTMDEAVEWVGTLELEETPSSLVAAPSLRPDPHGGWLAWDAQLQAARRYAPDGSLEAAFGGPGEGPGEFEDLVGVARLDDGRLVTLDGRGQLARWSEDGRLEADVATGLASSRGLVAFPGNRLAVVLPPRQEGQTVWGATVQVLDPETGAVERTLASIPLDPGLLTAAYTVQPTGPRRHGDSILVTLLDSAWAVPLAGGAPRGYSLRGPSGDSIEAIQAGSAGRTAVRDWLAQSVFIGEFGRLSDGRWVVGTFRVADGQVLQGLRLLDAQGEALWELESAPPLMAVGPDDRLFFADPEGLDPAKILVARLLQ